MKLSILIPMYNAEKYISNCLNSILNQQLKEDEYEILIMDDGSTDSSAEIVKEFVKKHQNISLFQEKNAGESSTRNKLFGKARGEYIYNIDADDYITANSLNFILQKAFKEDLDILAFDAIFTDSLKENNTEYEKLKSSKVIVQTGTDFISNNRNMIHAVWWYMIKRSFLESTGIEFEKHKFNGDLVFTMSLFLKCNKFGYCPVSVYRYVQTEDSVVRSGDITKRRIYIENTFQMMVNFSKLINSIDGKAKNDKLIDNLRHRLDKSIFFNTIKMIRMGFPIKELKDKIDSLKKVKSYPIGHFIGMEYNSVLWKILNFMFNNEKILFTLVRLYNLLGLQQAKSTK